MARWQLREAKVRLGEVIRRARREGPQEVTVRGRLSAVVVSADEYERLQRRKPGFVRFIRSSPLAGEAPELERDRSPARDIEL